MIDKRVHTCLMVAFWLGLGTATKAAAPFIDEPNVRSEVPADMLSRANLLIDDYTTQWEKTADIRAMPDEWFSYSFLHPPCSLMAQHFLEKEACEEVAIGERLEFLRTNLNVTWHLVQHMLSSEDLFQKMKQSTESDEEPRNLLEAMVIPEVSDLLADENRGRVKSVGQFRTRLTVLKDAEKRLVVHRAGHPHETLPAYRRNIGLLRELVLAKQNSTVPTFFSPRDTYPELSPGVRGFELPKGMLIFEIIEEHAQLRILNVELLHD